MQLYAYRNTERSAQNSIATRKRQAEREQWLVSKRAEEMARQEAQEAQRRIAEHRARLAAFAAEMRARGVTFKHTYENIERRACKVFKVSKLAIRSGRRQRDIVFARQFVMYWTCRLTERSLPQIGRLMGGRDHTTVLHGKRQYVEKRAYMGRNLREAR